MICVVNDTFVLLASTQLNFNLGAEHRRIVFPFSSAAVLKLGSISCDLLSAVFVFHVDYAGLTCGLRLQI